MDKLDTETWEDYAFRNNLYKIKYCYKDVSVIVDITVPTHTKITRYDYSETQHMNDNIKLNIGFRPSFLEFILYELYNLKKYYGLWDIHSCIKVDKDKKRQQWLLSEKSFWEKQYLTKVGEDEKENEKERI